MSRDQPGHPNAVLSSHSLGSLLPGIVALALFALLAAFCAADPALGVTWSNSPFTDEGWNLLNARNFAVLGHWSTDEWTRHLISVPYSLIHAAVFMVAGTGIIQARLVEIAATAGTASVIVLGLRRTVGFGPALIGGIAFGTSALVLYYGRLALLEPLVALGMTVGAVLLATGSDRRPVLAGVVAGLGLAIAIGTKALAIPSTGGLLAVALLVGWRRRPARQRWTAAAITLAVAAAAWLVLIGLPHRAAVTADLATLPLETAPANLGQALARIRSYVFGSDGVLTLGAPLLIGGAVGAVVGLVRWRRLEPATRDLLVIAIGWFIASFGLLTLVPYAPSRYVVPSLPPLALMIGVGAHALFSWRPWPSWFRPVSVVAIVVVLSAPGLITYARWTASAPMTVPSVQARFAAAIPPGVTVAGNYAPLLAMRTRGPTVFSLFGINQGDLYTLRGVRWVVVQQGEVPSWAAQHPVAWAARRLILATTWGMDRVELYQLP